MDDQRRVQRVDYHLCGTNYGAGRLDRIEKGTRICLLMDQGVSLFMTAVMLIFSRQLFSIFTTDPEVIAHRHHYFTDGRSVLCGIQLH